MFTDRYASAIPDFDAFRRALQRPVSTDVRVHPNRLSVDTLRQRFEEEGATVTTVPWFDRLLRVRNADPPTGKRLEFGLGLYHLQGATSVAAALALAPGPNDRVLDLCAAPGSKTTLLAELVGDEGFVIANDVSTGRTRALGYNIDRLGAFRTAVLNENGAHFPGPMTFDAILVDAPCTGEGTARQGDHPVESANRAELTDLQLRLLRRATNMLRPGGRLVYSTCTYAPEENEAVLTRLLSEKNLEVESPLPNLPSEPGWLAFDGDTFDPRLDRAMRFYPHRIDSWGFFVARLRKPDSADHPAPSPEEAASLPDGPEADDARRHLEEVYGVPPDVLERFWFGLRGRSSVWMAGRGVPAPLGQEPYRPQQLGIRALRKVMGHWKPTTTLCHVLGPAIRKRRFEMDEETFRRFLTTGFHEVTGLEPGYYVITTPRFGVAAVALSHKRGLESMFPRKRLQNL